MRNAALATLLLAPALAASCASTSPAEPPPGDAGAAPGDELTVLPDRSEGPVCEGVDLFLHTCASLGCHWNGPDPGGGLDLVSPGLRDRLLGPSSCRGRPYLDPVDLDASFLLEKLTMDVDTCGGAGMPRTSGSRLPQPVLDCIRAWMATLSSR